MVKTPGQRRKEMQEALKNRTEESYKNREDSGKYGGIFKKELEISEWRCGKGEHAIDTIPYIVGEGNPNPNIKAGDFNYVLDLWVHSGVGVNEDMYICPARTYKERCPICEEQKRLRDEDVPEETIKSLNPVRRCIYNIVCYDTADEEAKGVQVWMVAHFFMEKHLSKLARQPRGGGYVAFSHPDVGKLIMFDRTGVGASNTAYDGHRLVDRNYVISDEILDAAYCLEDIIHKPTYEEIHQAFWGKDVVEATEDLGVAPADEEDTPFDDPLPSRSTIRGKRPKKEETVENACPHGGTFGIDIDKIDDCANCTPYEKCAIEADRLEEEEKKKRLEKRLGKLKR